MENKKFTPDQQELLKELEEIEINLQGANYTEDHKTVAKLSYALRFFFPEDDFAKVIKAEMERLGVRFNVS